MMREELCNDDRVGSYVLGPEVGVGGHATVHMGYDKREKRVVAVKVLDMEEDAMNAAQEEASIQGKFDSPQIVRLYEHIAGSRHNWLVLEYVTGPDLHTALMEGWVLSEVLIAEITRMILLAVAEMHEHEVVNRDLKLENVLLHAQEDGSYAVKVCDFGSASRGEEWMLERQGTSVYLSPQMMGGTRYSRAADLWNVGMIVAELLMGRPFGSGEDRLLQRLRKGEVSADGLWRMRGSQGAKIFLLGLLHPEEEKRLTARGALDHAWLRSAKENMGGRSLSVHWRRARPVPGRSVRTERLGAGREEVCAASGGVVSSCEQL
jgi:serine/threonine protein kinase